MYYLLLAKCVTHFLAISFSMPKKLKFNNININNNKNIFSIPKGYYYINFNYFEITLQICVTQLFQIFSFFFLFSKLFFQK